MFSQMRRIFLSSLGGLQPFVISLEQVSQAFLEFFKKIDWIVIVVIIIIIINI
jgi:hypothetical protein